MKTIEKTDCSTQSCQELQQHYRSFPANLLSDNAGYRLIGELPGVEKKDLKVTVDAGILTVQGAVVQTESESIVVREEATTGSFFRTFRLSETIDSEAITAQLDNGVLTLNLPTKEVYRSRSIKIED